MHINYWQFLRYGNTPLDNVVLITPNEGMSAQHLDELRKSGIPAARYGETSLTLFSGGDQIPVTVIDIYKLKEERKGEGVTVEVDEFEGNNLVFVDEGHKGSGGVEWRKVRQLMARSGFTFEYSATFAQAINAATQRGRELLREYSKAIIFDYSYKYFYDDGYGKDYNILNLSEEFAEELTDTWLLGNLLAFYQQRKYYDEHEEELRGYNLEAPLWIFVGSSVTAVPRSGKSDVLRIVLFLRRVLGDPEWAVETIGNILAGKTELKDDKGRDVFADQFTYLQESGNTDAGALYADIRARIFRASGQSRLQLVELKAAQGEIGLKIAGAQGYFGVINIGDTSKFLSLASDVAPELVSEPDNFSPSLFEAIAEPVSSVNILIGSKKFIEGWNSWRVSSMGLMNVGRGEGPQIIQLFGRGVRLRGYQGSLKRSSAIPNMKHPEHIRLVETLSIFGVRANYMQQFRDYLEREGVDYEQIPLPIEIKRVFLKRGLLAPRVPVGRDFAQEEFFSLIPEGDGPVVTIDLRPRVEVLASASGDQPVAAKAEEHRTIPDALLDAMDWDSIWQAMLRYKQERGMFNLALNKDMLRRIVSGQRYRLYCPEDYLEIDSFGDIARVEQIVLMILRAAVRRLYNRHRQSWEMTVVEYERLGPDDPCFSDYTLRDSNKTLSEGN